MRRGDAAAEGTGPCLGATSLADLEGGGEAAAQGTGPCVGATSSPEAVVVGGEAAQGIPPGAGTGGSSESGGGVECEPAQGTSSSVQSSAGGERWEVVSVTGRWVLADGSLVEQEVLWTPEGGGLVSKL